MINHLIKLSLFLKKNNLKKEANYIKKIAQEDEELIDIISPDEELSGDSFTRNRILPDQNLRKYKDKLGLDSGKYHERWYGAVKELDDKIILIPYKLSNLSNNDLAKMYSIFGDDKYLKNNFDDNFSHQNLLSIALWKKGSLQKLKEVFPSLWSEILSTLNKEGLEEDQVVYMLYNQDISNEISLDALTKDEFYFAHDMGHLSEIDDDLVFRESLKLFLDKILSLYRGIGIAGDLNSNFEKDANDPYFKNTLFLKSFFLGTRSGSFDLYADIYYLFSSGNIKMEAPKSLFYGNNFYVLSDISKANDIIKKYIKDMKYYIKSKKHIESKYKGSVAIFPF